MSYADLSAPLRTAIVGTTAITSQLTAYKGSFPVFTRRPVDPDAPFPMIIVSPDITKTDEDGINDQRPIIERDVTVYGLNDTPASYVAVGAIARSVHDLFHRQRNSITVSDWGVVMITATGPIPAPTDDDKEVARMVSLRIYLAKKN